MNIDKLRKLQQYLRDEPRRFDMSMWVGDQDTVAMQEPPCGTVACMAGLACHMEGYQLQGEFALTEVSGVVRTIPELAAEILSLNFSQRGTLFFLSNWDLDLQDLYQRTRSLQYKAEAACQMIDRLIERGHSLEHYSDAATVADKIFEGNPAVVEARKRLSEPDATSDNVPCAGEDRG